MDKQENPLIKADTEMYLNAVESCYRNFLRAKQDLKIHFNRNLEDIKQDLYQRGVPVTSTSISQRIAEIIESEQL